MNKVHKPLLEKLLKANDYRVRAAATRTVRYNADKLSNATALLIQSAADKHAQVRHEALIAASWMPEQSKSAIITEFKKTPVDKWSKMALTVTTTGDLPKKAPKIKIPKHIAKNKALSESYKRGLNHYNHGESCGSCHGANGEGIKGAFPPLNKSKWVNGDKELLAKIALHGISGELEVRGQKYAGVMPGFAFRTKNKEIADVLTYVRNAWGNINGDGYTEKEIADLLKKTEKTQQGMYEAKKLKEEYKLK